MSILRVEWRDGRDFEFTSDRSESLLDCDSGGYLGMGRVRCGALRGSGREVRDDFGFGIRVPLIVISPYAKQGKVSHELGEFSSVLRFIEDNWNLRQLTHRDREATPLLSAFDFSQEPRPPDPLPLRDDCEGPIWKPAK